MGSSRTALIGAGIALVGGGSVPDADAAKKRATVKTLTGHVMAAPFKSGRKVVIPVLLDRRASKRARLRARVGVLTFRTSKRVKLAGRRARLAPALLRAGDRLRARAKVARAARRGPHWSLPARSLKVTKRSRTLNAVELATSMTRVRRQVAALGSAMTRLADYVAGGFLRLDGDVSDLRTALDSLTGSLAGLEQRVKELEQGLPALESRLQAQIDALARDVDTLEAQMTTVQAQLGSLGGDLAALEERVAQMQSDVDALCGPSSPTNAIC